MSQFLFIHGTSVRKDDYNETIFRIEKRLKPFGHTVLPCRWGDKFGVPESGWGASIPGFNVEKPHPPDPAEALWILLFQDPTFRLRELIPPVEQQWSAFPTEALWQAFLTLEIPAKLLTMVDDHGLTPYWTRTLAQLRGSDDFAAILKPIPNPPEEVSVELARAIVAAFLIDAVEAGAPALMPAARDEMVNLLATAIGVERNVFDRPLAFLVRNRRDWAMKAFVKYAADILLYQTRGEAIQTEVRKTIENATGKVIVLAHSLGGVAAVDVLAANDLRHKVSHLVTAGCQAPFFYEINALQSLAGNKTLPTTFPENWLNLYDESDILSFLAEPIFSPTRVKDFENKSKLPPIAAHSAYWDSPAVWERIAEFVA